MRGHSVQTDRKSGGRYNQARGKSYLCEKLIVLHCSRFASCDKAEMGQGMRGRVCLDA